MPEVKFQHVVSCSSEDRNNPAENLLKPQGTHKWKSAKAGEKQISVVLQFDKAIQINAIDIGNEGSAFVEVLVGKSTALADSDYEVILVASAFMSPTESRNGTNRNSVRMFGADKLSKTTASSKWDRVKVVCTQPFNKNATYGLSFIKLHSPSDGKSVNEKPAVMTQKKLGAFLLKPDEEDDIKIGSVFASRNKEKPDTPPLKGAAAVRAASKVAEESKRAFHDLKDSGNHGDGAVKTVPGTSSTPAKTKRKHDVSSDEEDDVTPVTQRKPPLKKQGTSLTSLSKDDSTPPLKKTKSEPPKKSAAKAFSQLMEKVVFVLSGFQNPYRGELRDKAMEMGAKYRPDWGRGATHLVCAFENTPKYNQVKGKGFIVKKTWIEDCYKQKQLLSWRKYRLGSAPSPDISEEEDNSVEEYKPSPKKSPVKPTPKQPAKKPDDDIYGGDTDSGEDTEDEIRRAKVKVAAQEAASKKTTAAEAEAYDDSTDEDEPVKPVAEASDEGSDSGLPDLPDFFTDKMFFLYGDFEPGERRLLTRYITAYDGEVSEYMSDKVNYILTSAPWDDNFEEALSENPSLVFVKPKWIHMCNEKNKLVPYQPFIVVPR